MLEAGQLDDAIFDPFTAPFILKAWHNRIEIVSAPEVSRVYGVPLRGGPCCLWTGWSNGKGHGIVQIGGKRGRIYLHRYAYQKFNNVELSTADAVDHLCRNRPCFNPYHLECTSFLENHLRGNGVDTQFKRAQEYEETLTEEDIAALAGDWRT